jgi:hypothetical protein
VKLSRRLARNTNNGSRFVKIMHCETPCLLLYFLSVTKMKNMTIKPMKLSLDINSGELNS